MGDTQTAPPGAERMLLVDAQDRRVVLIELRLDRGASPPTVRRRFNRLFKDVFGTTGPPQPVPVARHYVRCVLTPDEITECVGETPTGSAASGSSTEFGRIWC
jgi:hypothetical protein